MSDDPLPTAVETLLRQAPDSWADAPVEQDALAVLTAAGFVERRITFTVRLPGEEQTQRITIETTGEFGFAEAMEAVVQDWWARWGQRWRELRQEIGAPVKPIVTRESDAWRLTDQGRQAQADLEQGESRPIDFALKRGFFDGQPRLLPDGRISRREPVRGYGRVVSVENASSPLAIDVAKFSAASELAEAFVKVFERYIPKPTTAEETPPAAFVFARSGDGWFIRAFGEEGHFRNLRGLWYIAKLLQKPNVAIPVKLLVRDESDMPARNATVDCGELDAEGHSVQPIADKEALEAYKQRLKELNADIAKAERAGCAAEVEELQREQEFLVDTIKEACGPGGRQRAFGTEADKLRQSVLQALNRAYSALRKAKPPLMQTAGHFEAFIAYQTGDFIYQPATPPDWQLIL